MIRLFGFPLSLNTERITLALAYKRLPVEVVIVDPEDRAIVRRVSGQDLVPVIEEDGVVVRDSTAILRHLEKRHPDPPLFPRERSRREEADVFLDWFNGVWKGPPNYIFEEERRPAPDHERLAAWGLELGRSLDRFESLLSGRAYLLGEDFSAADCAAWPFLRYGVWRERDDPWRFHHILMEHLEARPERHPALIDWIARVAERPQVALRGA